MKRRCCAGQKVALKQQQLVLTSSQPEIANPPFQDNANLTSVLPTSTFSASTVSARCGTRAPKGGHWNLEGCHSPIHAFLNTRGVNEGNCPRFTSAEKAARYVTCADTLMYGREGSVKAHSASTGNVICYAALPALCWQEHNNSVSNRILVIQIQSQHLTMKTKSFNK